MHFDRFDICEAAYLFACLWHGGQGSREYQIFGRLHRLRFKASPALSFETMTPNAREIFGRFVWRYCARIVVAERWKRRARGRL